ncbi:MAG: hypothetical protein V3S37_07415 [Dehalococcoidia bacterium]
MALKAHDTIQEVSLEQPVIQGFWPWFFQRATGLLLIFLLAIHIWVSHFAGLEEVISGQQEELVLFNLVKERLRTTLIIVVDFSLLALVLYHGLNGIRSILLDLGLDGRKKRVANLVLAVVGVGAFLYGGNTLLVLILR